MKLLDSYPYLVTSLAGLVVIGIALTWCRPPQRKLAVLSGLLTTPFGFSSVMVVPDYWNPRRVVEFWGTGFEDLVFSFVVGSLVWLCASGHLRDRVIVQIRVRDVFGGYVSSSAAGLSIVLLAGAVGCDPMTGILISFTLGSVVLLIGNPDRWRLAAAGAAGFALVYTILVELCLWWAPGFLEQWNPAGPWGQTVFGLPLGEIVWAVSFGAVWPLHMALLLRAQVSPSPAATVRVSLEERKPTEPSRIL